MKEAYLIWNIQNLEDLEILPDIERLSFSQYKFSNFKMVILQGIKKLSTQHHYLKNQQKFSLLLQEELILSGLGHFCTYQQTIQISVVTQNEMDQSLSGSLALQKNILEILLFFFNNLNFKLELILGKRNFLVSPGNLVKYCQVFRLTNFFQVLFGEFLPHLCVAKIFTLKIIQATICC